MLAEVRENKPKTALFSEVFKKYIDQHKHTPTIESIKSAERRFILFYTREKYDKLICSNVNYDLIENFYNYLVNDRGLAVDTIRGTFIYIRAVINLAIRRKVCSETTHPFKEQEGGKYFNWKRVKSVKVHKSLPLKFINQLANYKAYSQNDLYSQVYIFSCLSPRGRITIPTLMHLRKRDIEVKLSENGSVRYFRYAKHCSNKKDLICELTPKMETILKEMEANYDLYDDYLFPFIQKENYTELEYTRLYTNIKYKYRIGIEDAKKFFKDITCPKEQFELIKDKRSYLMGRKRAILIWFFSHFAQGMNTIDMMMLKYSAIQTMLDDDGNLVRFIQYKRSKTDQQVTFPITKQLQEIIDFFEENEHLFPRVDGYILPLVDKDYSPKSDGLYKRKATMRTNLNQNLQKIAEELEWPEALRDITLYWARHSYAQRCLLGGANKEYIQNALGHKELSVTEGYVEGWGVTSMNEFNEDLFSNGATAV